MPTLRKTFKREIGVAGVVFWGLMSWLLFKHTDAQTITALAAPYSAMTYSVWGYAAAAFGLHAYATQMGQH